MLGQRRIASELEAAEAARALHQQLTSQAQDVAGATSQRCARSLLPVVTCKHTSDPTSVTLCSPCRASALPAPPQQQLQLHPSTLRRENYSLPPLVQKNNKLIRGYTIIKKTGKFMTTLFLPGVCPVADQLQAHLSGEAERLAAGQGLEAV